MVYLRLFHIQLTYNHWVFANYDPRCHGKMFHAVTLERDEKMMDTFNDAVPQFLHEMDMMLDRLGLRFGDQWK